MTLCGSQLGLPGLLCRKEDQEFQLSRPVLYRVKSLHETNETILLRTRQDSVRWDMQFHRRPLEALCINMSLFCWKRRALQCTMSVAMSTRPMHQQTSAAWTRWWNTYVQLELTLNHDETAFVLRFTMGGAWCCSVASDPCLRDHVA